METFNNAGTIASIAGLAISIWLIFITRGAKKAAQEAKELVYNKNLLAELREINKTIDQIRNEIDKGIRSTARFLLVDTKNQIDYFKSKWNIELKGRGNIGFAREELKIALDAIDLCGNHLVEDDEKKRLLISISKVQQNFNEELGFFDRKSSRES